MTLIYADSLTSEEPLISFFLWASADSLDHTGSFPHPILGCTGPFLSPFWAAQSGRGGGGNGRHRVAHDLGAGKKERKGEGGGCSKEGWGGTQRPVWMGDGKEEKKQGETVAKEYY